MRLATDLIDGDRLLGRNKEEAGDRSRRLALMGKGKCKEVCEVGLGLGPDLVFVVKKVCTRRANRCCDCRALNSPIGLAHKTLGTRIRRCREFPARLMRSALKGQ